MAKSEQSLFVIELPPYRIPQWRTLVRRLDDGHHLCCSGINY
ncbi:hypothetical protein [Paenibacillus tyrfis]